MRLLMPFEADDDIQWHYIIIIVVAIVIIDIVIDRRQLDLLLTERNHFPMKRSLKNLIYDVIFDV